MEIRIYCNEDIEERQKIYLQPGEVHIWCIRWTEMQDYWEKYKIILNLKELEKAERYHFQEDKMRYLAGKIIAKLLLMQYLDEKEIFF